MALQEKEIAESKGEKLFWADNLRVIATIAVIFLHVSATVLYKFNTVPRSYWWIGNIYDSSVRFCVPVFVMLTGALLLSKEYILGVFLKKRLLRVVLPFAFWSLIYLIYYYRLHYLYETRLSRSEDLHWIFFYLKKGSSFHLWYVYMIIGIYLFIPIIGKWVRVSTEKEILYFLSIWLITLFLTYPSISENKLNIDLTYFTGFIGYLVLGYYLSTKTFGNKKRTDIISIFLIVSGIVITIVGTYLFSLKEKKFNSVFYEYLTPNILMVSVGLFLFIKNRQDFKSEVLLTIRNFINKFSYGIYLVHEE